MFENKAGYYEPRINQNPTTKENNQSLDRNRSENNMERIASTRPKRKTVGISFPPEDFKILERLDSVRLFHTRSYVIRKMIGAVLYDDRKVAKILGRDFVYSTKSGAYRTKTL